jgi:hypothetical protein
MHYNQIIYIIYRGEMCIHINHIQGRDRWRERKIGSEEERKARGNGERERKRNREGV